MEPASHVPHSLAPGVQTVCHLSWLKVSVALRYVRTFRGHRRRGGRSGSTFHDSWLGRHVSARPGGSIEQDPVIDRRMFIAGTSAVLLAVPLAAEAQRLLLYEGRVQWIAGSTLILATDDGWSIRVDLTRVPQSDYSGLGPRDRIIVSGALSQDGKNVLGLSIERVRSDYQSP
jgi:hypothetical protein